MSTRIQLLWKSSLHRHYPTSQLCRFPSPPPALCSAPSRLPSHTRSISVVDVSRALVAAWLLLCHYVLLDAVCDPGEGTTARLVAVRPRCTGPAMPGHFSPLGRVSPSSSPSAQPHDYRCVPVACVLSREHQPFPNDIISGLTTGFSFYRFTSQPFLLLFRIQIRAVD